MRITYLVILTTYWLIYKYIYRQIMITHLTSTLLRAHLCRHVSLCFCCASHLYIGGVPLTVSPRAGDGWEGAVRVVELVVIGTKEECGEGLLKRKRIWHHKDQRSPPKSKVIIILIIIFFTLLICISNATIIIKITKNIRTVGITGSPCSLFKYMWIVRINCNI